VAIRSIGAMSETPNADPVGRLRTAVEGAALELDGTDLGPRITLERPPKAELGDYSTNAAMLLAPRVGAKPRDVAERLRGELSERLGESAARIEVAGPGFLNLFLSDRWHREAVAGILAAGERFGAAPPSGERVLVEFVSANPTGPLTVAGGRGAAFGDAVARLLGFAGDEVEREYYINDAGAQVRLFADSIAARVRGEEPPEGGYEGAYVGELAAELADAGVGPDDLEALEREGVARMQARIKATLERFRVEFDSWFSERSLQQSEALDETIRVLRESGHAYEREDALWLRTTSFGDDKDRVLIRASGEPTYFATDIAYHRDKLGRGFDHLVTPLGADHHGYVARMKAAIGTLGHDPGRYEALIMQLVNVVEGGARARMSKRRGEFVTLDELVADIGVDAARYFMVQRSHDTTIDLDLELARSTSQDNPVYYVQYAHARIASILRKAESEGVELTAPPGAAAAEVLDAACEPSERSLARRLLDLPAEASEAAARRAPHRICAYASATAADFHAFYRDCRVVGAEPPLEAARLALCHATAGVIATALELVGVTAPERM
jgi:arginyl-tRNA synthetase